MGPRAREEAGADGPDGPGKRSRHGILPSRLATLTVLMGCGSGPAGAGKAPDPLQIGMGPHGFQSPRREQAANGIALIVMVLQQDPTPGGESSPGTGHDPADRIQPIEAPIEGQSRLVKPHHRLQTIHNSAGDVGRVGDHQGEASPPGAEVVPPVGTNQLDPCLQPHLVNVERRDGQGFISEVGGQADAPGQGPGQGNGQTS